MFERYKQLVHAMQTGVAHMMERDPAQVAPKHLRVGVNTALCDSAALARLLMKKGLFTEAEYEEAITAEMEAEVKRYEAKLSTSLIKVTLL